MPTNPPFPAVTIKATFETGDKPTQAQFATFIDGVAAIDANSPLNNFSATTEPTINDDSNDGYSIGSRWVDTATDSIYECVDSTIGGAVWKQVQTGIVGVGTVTSVSVSAPSEFSVTGSPVTTSGTITLSKNAQVANKVYSGPNTGADAQPTFRSLVSADLGTGTADSTKYLRGDGTWNNPFSMSVFCDQKSSGTSGGAFTSGAWQTRTLNTTQYNGITSASLASNQISLPAGTYYIKTVAPAFFVNLNQLRVQNITDATTAILGMTQQSDSGGSGSLGSSIPSFAEGVITIAATKVFEVQHRCQVTNASGFGTAASFGTEQYATIFIQKIA